MDDNDGGFSFGAPADIPPVADYGEVDVVEVSGEPVSRSEAKQMGLVNVDPSVKESSNAKASTNILRMEQLPADLGVDLAQKLEKAWDHLRRNEIEQALTLAQEVVWQYPALVAAKLIIARCFINRKEYEKALAILQAISENEMSSETLYYIGLCQSRLGRIKDAIDTLTLSKAAATDSMTRKRATDLIQQLQGEQTVCPVCGKKALYDSMVEVGNRTICANCARGDAGDDFDDDEYDEDEEGDIVAGGRRRKRLRPPLTWSEVLLRILLGVIIVFVLGVFLYFVFPSTYTLLRSYLPASWYFIPTAYYTQPETLPPRPVQPETTGPRVLPSLVLDSPPLRRAIVDVEMRHQLAVSGMEDREREFHVAIVPQPNGPYELNPATGLFVWTPSAEDGGKNFTITFNAVFKNVQSMDQVNTVRVSPGADFRQVAQWPRHDVDTIAHLLIDDFTNSDGNEIIVVSGEYLTGEAVILEPDAEGMGRVVASVSLKGRPVGIGMVMADQEKWLAVADFWSSRIRYFSYRNNNLSEMALRVELPGRPLLAGFSLESSVSAALCKTGGGMRVLAFRQNGQLRSEQFGDWRVPDEHVWRKLLVFGSRTDEEKPKLVLAGADFPGSLQVLEEGQPVATPFRHDTTGTLIDVAADTVVRRLHCLVEKDGLLSIISYNLEQPSQQAVTSLVGPAPALGGMAVLRGPNAVTDDLAVLSSQRVGIAFGESERSRSEAYFWPLPAPPLPLTNPKVGMVGSGPEMVYLGMDGQIWSMRLGG